MFFAIGVTGADKEVLKGLAPDSYYDLGNMSFAQVLRLVSASIESVAEGSRTGPAAEAYAGVRDRIDKRKRILEFLEGSG